MNIIDLINQLDSKYNVSRQTIISTANIIGPENYNRLETIISALDQAKAFFNTIEGVKQ